MFNTLNITTSTPVNALPTPWQHGARDIYRTGERYNAHDTGALLARLQSDYFWEVSTQYTRRSHDPLRRPFALHAATLRHPDAPTFEALGQKWSLALYVRNAHDGTAALTSSLLLTRHGVRYTASMFAQAPASCRVTHMRTNDEAQRIASSAADAIPTASALLLQWANEPARHLAADVLQTALLWRHGPEADGTSPLLRSGWAVQPVTRLDEYVAAACVALQGGYYLTSSKRVARPVTSVLTREKLMAQAWAWATT
jgi:hypothetical protein